VERLVEFWRRVRHWWQRDRLSRELDAEMRFHLEMAAAEYRREGLSDRAAAAAAHRRFGNLTWLAEQGAEAWSWPAVEQFLRDIGLAARTLAKRPVWVLVTVASLAFGLGAATAVFTVANALFLRPPAAVSHPERLVVLYTSRDDGTAYGQSSYADYRDVGASVPSLAGVAASQYDAVTTDTPGERLFIERVTGNYFDVMGVAPVVGRTFAAGETTPGQAEAVAVISASLWERRFQRDPRVVGRTARLNGRLHTVIGVAPPGLASRFLSLQPDAWLPLGLADEDPRVRNAILERRTTRDLRVLGRLAPGADVGRVRAQVAVVERRLLATHRDDWLDQDGRPRHLTVLTERAARIDPANRALLITVGGFFGAVSLLILLAACTNVMSLFLAEIGRRRREVAVRLALGASRSRVVRLLMTEALLIGLAGGLAGAILADAGLKMLVRLPMPFGVPFQVDLSADWRVLAAAFVLAVGASLAFALAPSIQASRLHVLSSLKRETVGLVAAGRRVSLRTALVVAQLAAALVLVCGATLMTRSVRATSDAELGIAPDRIATMTKRLPRAGEGDEPDLQFVRTIGERLAGQPGVAGVAVSAGLELAGGQIGMRVAAEGTDPKTARFGVSNAVTPGYLELLGVKMRRGRTIQEGDVAGAPLVAIVNEPMAHLLWPSTDPIGRRFVLERLPGPNSGDPRDPRIFEVAGVARRAVYWEVGTDEVPYCWTSLYQDPAPTVAVSLKGAGSAGDMVQLLRRSVEIERDEVTPVEPSVLADRIAANLAPQRLASRVLGWGGAFALALAVIGVFGSVSFTVARRTREFAVRLAVGARHRQILARVVLDGLGLAAAGVIGGTLVAVPLAWLIRNQLYGVSPIDPVSYGLTAILLAGAAAAGGILPARRVLRIDPVAVLKEE